VAIQGIGIAFHELRERQKCWLKTMLGAAQVVPFHRPPKKEWNDGCEKKKRLVIDLTRDEDDDIEEENFTEYIEDDLSESSEDSGFDIVDHIADLLPGEIVDGKKPTKQANMSHLEDLRLVAKKADRLGLFRRIYRFIQRKRAEERERRKHYILKEWEAMIMKYDEDQKKAILEKMKAHRKEVLLELHRSEQRRMRNSRKVCPPMSFYPCSGLTMSTARATCRKWRRTL
jgi:hypothetical protein